MLYSTLKVSSVQDKKQCDPEEAAAKGKTTGEVGSGTRNPLLYFHARGGSRCSSHVSTRTTRESQVQRVGHTQQNFTRIVLLFPSHSSQCARTSRAATAEQSDNCLHSSK